MRVSFERVTVAQTFSLEGVGIHSGHPSDVTVEPGTNGIRFRSGGDWIAATPENVSRTARSTWLGNVRTVEHLMSALGAFGVTDADVTVSAEELPILGGGALEYSLSLRSAGTAPLGIWRTATIFGRVNLTEEGQSVSISAGEGRWKYVFDAGDRWPGRLEFETSIDSMTYTEQIAPAKTTVFEEEIEAVLAAGLGRGGSEDNTLVLGSDGYRFGKTFDDEPARHKLLDLMGDLALAGVPLRFLNVSAEKSGHTLNVKAAARLAQLCRWED